MVDDNDEKAEQYEENVVDAKYSNSKEEFLSLLYYKYINPILLFLLSLFFFFFYSKSCGISIYWGRNQTTLLFVAHQILPNNSTRLSLDVYPSKYRCSLTLRTGFSKRSMVV